MKYKEDFGDLGGLGDLGYLRYMRGQGYLEDLWKMYDLCNVGDVICVWHEQFSLLFTDSALLAGLVIESPCPSVCLCVCLFTKVLIVNNGQKTK